MLMGLPASETGVLQPNDDKGRLETFFDPIEPDKSAPAPVPPRPSRDMRYHSSNRGYGDRVDPVGSFNQGFNRL